MMRLSYLAPNEVAFQVDKNMTTLDIHQYLVKVYGVIVHEVRTMNKRTYKKAVVVLDQPWSPPPEPSVEELGKIALPNSYFLLQNKKRDKGYLKNLLKYEKPSEDEQRRLSDPHASKKLPVKGYHQ